MRNILLYPNPASRYLNIDIECFNTDLGYYLEIYSIEGQIIKSIALSLKHNIVDLECLKNQFYLYKIIKSGAVMETGKFTKH